MTLLAVSLLLQQIVISLCIGASSSLMMQEGGLISDIGNLFGQALRELTESEPEPQPVFAEVQREVFGFDDQPKVMPGESDQKKHSERIQLLSAAFETWVTLVCQLDEAQQIQLSELVPQRRKIEEERYATSHDPMRQNRPFGPSTPILFVQPDGDGAKFVASLLDAVRNQILDDTQKAALDAAITERREFQNAAFREYFVSIVDAELFLTEEQRQAMLEQFASKPDLVTSPFYSFVAQTYYLPYKPIGGILKANQASYLDSRQLARLKDLTSGADNGNSNYIMFESSEGPEQWEANVRRSIVKQRTIYLHAAAVRIGYLERALQLSPEHVQFLTVASKGATVAALDEWKESTQRTINQMQEQMAQIQGNFSFSAQNITTDGLDSNAIWTHAVKKVNANNLSTDRMAAIRAARAKAVTALLDQELCLMPDQRVAVQKFSEAALPRNSNHNNSYDDYVREIILLAYPLHKGVEPKMMEILSPSQQEVWIHLKGFLRMNRANNYVEIPMENHGGSFSVSLSD